MHVLGRRGMYWGVQGHMCGSLWIGVPKVLSFGKGVQAAWQGTSSLSHHLPGAGQGSRGLPEQRGLTVHTEVAGAVSGVQVSTPALLTSVAGCRVRALTAPPVGAVKPTGRPLAPRAPAAIHYMRDRHGERRVALSAQGASPGSGCKARAAPGPPSVCPLVSSWPDDTC